MAIPLKEYKKLQPIKQEPRKIPIEQIVQTMGRSSAADRMKVVGETVGKALETTGAVIGEVLERKAKLRRQGEELAQAEKAAGVAPGSFGTDLDTATALKAYELKLKRDKPDNEGGYFIPRGLDPQSNRPVYSHSKKPGLFFDDMTPFGGAPGALTLQKLPSEQIAKEEQFANLHDAIKKVGSAYKKSYVGPAQATVGKAGQYFDLTASPEKATFYSNLQDVKNQIIYLRSGKQINEAEFERLMKALPNEYTSDVDFESRYNNFIDIFGNIMKTRSSAFSSSGYRSPGTGVSFGPELKIGQGGGQEVLRKTGDGRTAVFDSNTKKFIRWAE